MLRQQEKQQPQLLSSSLRLKIKARFKKWGGKKKKIRYDRQKRSPSAEQGSFDPTTTLLINFKIRAKPPTRDQNGFKWEGGGLIPQLEPYFSRVGGEDDKGSRKREKKNMI